MNVTKRLSYEHWLLKTYYGSQTVYRDFAEAIRKDNHFPIIGAENFEHQHGIIRHYLMARQTDAGFLELFENSFKEYMEAMG